MITSSKIEHGAVLRRELAQPLEEPRLRQHRADVVRDRLEDDRGDVVLGERALDVVGVVEAADDRRVDRPRAGSPFESGSFVPTFSGGEITFIATESCQPW